MKNKRIILIMLSVAFLFTNCKFIGNIPEFKEAVVVFSENLLDENYDKCIELMDMDHELATRTDIDSMKLGLIQFREMIVKNWGTELEYKFVNAKKTKSTSGGTPPNSTLVIVEFSNEKELGAYQVLLDDDSKLVLNIKTLDLKEPIPNMVIFWLFGIFALCVPAFNIYILREIRKSNLERKKAKYLGVFLLNAPSITYSAIGGISFKLLSFQFILGLSFGYMGNIQSFWTLGIPLGGIYWLNKIRNEKKKENALKFEEKEN